MPPHCLTVPTKSESPSICSAELNNYLAFRPKSRSMQQAEELNKRFAVDKPLSGKAGLPTRPNKKGQFLKPKKRHHSCPVMLMIIRLHSSTALSAYCKSHIGVHKQALLIDCNNNC